MKKLCVAVLGCLIFAGVIGSAYHLSPSGTAEAASAPSQSTSNTWGAVKAIEEQRAKQYPHYLVIKEWGVQIGLADSIKDATYHLDGNTAWLSTQSLDLDATCYDRSKAQSPTFAGILRHVPSDIITISTMPTDPGTSMTASQAVSANQFEFRAMHGFVYQYKLDEDNEPCAAETHEQVNAFTDAWLSLRDQ